MLMESVFWRIFIIILGLLIYFSPWHEAYGLKCACDYHCPDDNHGNHTCETEGKCFAQIEVLEGRKVRKTHGCIQHPDDGGIWQCKAKKHQKPKTLLCCNDKDYCNTKLAPTLGPTLKPLYDTQALKPKQPVSEYPETSGIALVISVTVCAMLLVIVVTYLYFRYRQTTLNRRYDAERQIIIHDGTKPVGSLKELLDASQSMGGGSGVPLLIQRTIARQITLQFCVGRGRFGEVWKGRWRGEEVAVKIFSPKEESSWYREAEFYQTVLLRHDHILGFIAADIRGTGPDIQLLIITEYHKYGSLYDFLQNHTFDHRIMLRLAYTTISGLTYLHREINGMKGKPAIAHRDVKSKNILVKDNLTCAIGDLGLAVRLNPETRELEIGESLRLPTHRYMAPEVLDGTLETNHFDAYRVADLYSFGLVIWEIARRCQTSGFAEEYQAPYYEWVTADPSVDEMKNVVVTERRRPQIPSRWNSDQHLKMIATLITECWSHSPAARLTGLRIKKTLQKFVVDDESESSYS